MIEKFRINFGSGSVMLQTANGGDEFMNSSEVQLTIWQRITHFNDGEINVEFK